MNNVFTIDTEDWYHANFEDDLFTNDSNIISTVENNVYGNHKVIFDYLFKSSYMPV